MYTIYPSICKKVFCKLFISIKHFTVDDCDVTKITFNIRHAIPNHLEVVKFPKFFQGYAQDSTRYAFFRFSGKNFNPQLCLNNQITLTHHFLFLWLWKKTGKKLNLSKIVVEGRIFFGQNIPHCSSNIVPWTFFSAFFNSFLSFYFL